MAVRRRLTEPPPKSPGAVAGESAAGEETATMLRSHCGLRGGEMRPDRIEFDQLSRCARMAAVVECDFQAPSLRRVLDWERR